VSVLTFVLSMDCCLVQYKQELGYFWIVCISHVRGSCIVSDCAAAGILSSLAHKLISIRQAMVAKADEVTLDAKRIKLDMSFAVVATCDTASSLPSNLRVCCIAVESSNQMYRLSCE